VQVYKNYHNDFPNAKLLLCLIGLTFKPTEIVPTSVFAKSLALTKLLLASGAHLDGVAVEEYPTVWRLLVNAAPVANDPDDAYYIYDYTGTGGPDGLRLNPKQLQGFIDSLTTFAELVTPHLVEIDQMDIRMGVPYGGEESPTLESRFPNNAEWESVRKHTRNGISTPAWATKSFQQRQEWQGRVYEAALNAAFSVPGLYGTTLWGLLDRLCWLNGTDPDGWLYMPPAATIVSKGVTYVGDPQYAANADLLGDNPSTTGVTETFYQKPAYYGVRNAIENYFGKAFCVKDASGNDLVRFVHNGNVVVPRGTIHEGYSTWSNAGIASKSFIVRDTHGDIKAAVNPDGDVYLAGSVSEHLGTGSQQAWPHLS
jgi:hypothetical protein